MGGWGQQLAGPDEQYERLYLVLLDADPPEPEFHAYHVGDAQEPVSMEAAFDALMEMVVERNSDFYEWQDGKITRT